MGDGHAQEAHVGVQRGGGHNYAHAARPVAHAHVVHSVWELDDNGAGCRGGCLHGGRTVEVQVRSHRQGREAEALHGDNPPIRVLLQSVNARRAIQILKAVTRQAHLKGQRPRALVIGDCSLGCSHEQIVAAACGRTTWPVIVACRKVEHAALAALRAKRTAVIARYARVHRGAICRIENRKGHGVDAVTRIRACTRVAQVGHGQSHAIPEDAGVHTAEEHTRRGHHVAREMLLDTGRGQQHEGGWRRRGQAHVGCAG